MSTDLMLIAERRAGLAALLGELFLEEPGPQLAPLVEHIDALRPLANGDPAIATEYERCFLRGIPLHEAVFRSDDGQQGGGCLAAVVESYRRHGFTEHAGRRWRVAGVDHLGLELRCHAHLCQREAQAWRDDIADVAMSTVEAERQFLADHLSTWVGVALDSAADVTGDGPYRPLIDAAVAFVGEEHDRLRPAPALGARIPVAELPSNFGPARLTRLLLAPDRSGGWLRTDAIAVAARAIGVPWRPSDTRAALRHVIDAAYEGGDLAVVAGVLRPVFVRWAARWQQFARDEPGNAANWLAWADRAEAMACLLARMSDDGGHPTATRQVSETLIVHGDDAALLADTIDRVTTELRAAGFRVERP